MTVLLIIVGCVLAAVFIARENQRVSEAFTELVMFLVRPLGVVMNWVAQAIARLVAFIRAQFEEEDEPAPVQPAVPEGEAGQGVAATPAPPPSAHRRHLSRFIGALVLTALTILFGVGELYLAKMSIEPLLGLPSNSQSAPPTTVDWLSAGAMLAVSLFWGLVLIDLHRGTHLLPPQFLNRMRKPLLMLAWSCIGLSLAAFAVLGIWRGLEVSKPVMAATSPAVFTSGSLQVGGAAASTAMMGAPAVAPAPGDSAEPQWFDRFAPIFFGTSLTVLVGTSLVISFAGVIYLMRYLGVAVLALVLVPFAAVLLPLRILEQVFLTVVGFANRVLELIASVGHSILNTVGPPLADLRNYAHRRVRNGLSGGEVSDPPAGTRGVAATEPEPQAPPSEPERGAPTQAAELQPENLKDFNWGWTE